MIDLFETGVRIHPDAQFFSFVSREGEELSYTYQQTRIISAALARKMQAAGIRSGEMVLIDLPNCPEFVFFVLACSYGGFGIVMLDNSLSESEKLSRQFEAERAGYRIAGKIDIELARRLLSNVRRLPEGEGDIIKGVYGSRRSRSIMGESQDAIDDTIHFAERAAHLFDRDSLAVVMFSGGRAEKVAGKQGKLKAVPLTWANLTDASRIANDYLIAGGSKLWQERLPFNSFSTSQSARSVSTKPDATWQCVLPLSQIYGFQTIVRSVLARTPFRLYETLDAERILRDSESGEYTHIAVDDSALQDLLTVEEWRSDAIPGLSSRMRRYLCVLLVGRVRNARTMKRAYDLGARIFASYGIPETSGLVAASLITANYRGGIKPLDAYDIRIVDPDDEGFGRLAVRGPGVFEGYPNTKPAFTVDRFFITEERAALIDGLVVIKNRNENMFVSAGQNIYPVEIADVLRHVSGISGVHVFGVPDTRCGMLPVAAIERSDSSLTPKYVEETTRPWFSSITVPISIFVFDQLPRNEYGSLDRHAIEAIFSS